MPGLMLQAVLERWGPSSLEMVCDSWNIKNGSDIEKTRKYISRFLTEAEPSELMNELSDQARLLLRLLVVDGGDVEWTELERIFTQSAGGEDFDGAQKELRRRSLTVVYRTGGHGPVRRCLAVPIELLEGLRRAFTPALRKQLAPIKGGKDAAFRAITSASNILYWIIAILEEHPTAVDARGKPTRRYEEKFDALMKATELEEQLKLRWRDVPLFALRFSNAAGLAVRVAGEWKISGAFDEFCGMDDARRLELFFSFWRAHFPYHDPMFAGLFSVLAAMKPIAVYDLEQLTDVVRRHAFAPLRAGWATEGWGARRRDLFRTIIRPCYHLGLIKLGTKSSDERTITTIALTTWGRWALDGFESGRPTLRKSPRWLSVGSDFEVMAPGDLDLMTRRMLMKIARPVAVDNMLRFKIDKELVRTAAGGGMTEKQVLSFLKRHSRTPVPQNVAFNIKEWILARAKFRVLDAAVLIAPDKEAAELVKKHPALAGLVIEKISSRVFAVKRDGLKQAAKVLQEAGWGVARARPEPDKGLPEEPGPVSFNEFLTRVTHVPASPDSPPERLWIAIDELRDLLGKGAKPQPEGRPEPDIDAADSETAEFETDSEFVEILNLLRLAVGRNARCILTVRNDHGQTSRSFRARPLAIFNARGVLSLKLKEGPAAGRETAVPIKDILSVDFV